MKIGLEEYEHVDDHELMIDSGCFGYVGPLWFAPQFPVTSVSNIKVVAANDVALQRSGLKVVHGHVTTNRGKRILTRNTFDVMSVRKLLSTSALKCQAVTFIFSHGDDRIIFRNETANFISHDGHSHLHVRLADGLHLAKRW